MDNIILDKICAELVKVMGPVAPLVMRDKVKSVGADPASFPIEKIAELVEKLSYEVQDEEARAEFQEKALIALKSSNIGEEILR